MTQFLNDMIGEIDSFVGIIYSSNDFKEAAAALAVNEDKYTVFMGADEVRTIAPTHHTKQKKNTFF